MTSEEVRKIQESAAFQPSLPLLAVGGPNAPGPLVPLLLSMEGCATEAEMNGNVEATLNRGYTRLNEYLDKYSGTLSIVGAGPSIKETYKEIKGDVMACNSALGFLLDKGIVPKFSMMWDASPLVEKFAIPHPDILYFVAARCHPKVFERLEGCKIISWFAGGDHNIMDFLQKKGINEPLVNGGSAAVTRSMYLACALGYRDFHIFGADSSYANDGNTHVNGSLVPEKDMEIWVGNHEGNKRFRTTPEWCAQVEEFKAIYPYFYNYIGCSIEVYGDGLLPHVARIMATFKQPAEPLPKENHASV